MDLYTLGPTFLKENLIEEFSSAIWTERYGLAGDVTLVVDATPDMINKLREGTFLSLQGSEEVMLLETQSIDEGLLTVTGNTLLAFLDQRMIRTSPGHDVQYWYLNDLRPGEVLTTIVQEMCIDGPYLAPGYMLNVDSVRAKIPNLSIGATDISWGGISLAIPFGPVYGTLKTIAESYRLGISLYLDSADESGYSLKFMSYSGRDLTKDQELYPLVRFSPALDSLTNIKELRSIAGYKNVAYAYAPSSPEGLAIEAGVAFSDPDAETSIGFGRRVLIVFADDISTDEIAGSSITLRALLDQRARDGLANNNYTRVVDGEVVPQSDYIYGVHYRLGDVIELQGHSNLIQKARITEYIRSQDSSGEREYPTVSVITDAADIWFGGTD